MTPVNPQQPIDFDALNARLASLVEQMKTLHLATLNAQSEPLASYTPYIWHDGDFYVLVSELTEHTQNLLQRPELSILIIADETHSNNLFARQRLQLRCEVEEVGRDSADWGPITERMAARFGDLIGVLTGLSDFHCFRLTPAGGRYIEGFGQAYRIDPGSLDAVAQIRN